MGKFDGIGDIYALLYVNRKAPLEVINAAYKARMLKGGHPDEGGKNTVAVNLNKAVAILRDTTLRAEYDQYLDNRAEGTIGNYRILEQIGQGAFGTTFKASHLLLDELACLKKNINISPEDTVIMVKEAKVLWKLHHYSLPTVRDFFKTPEGYCVFAMSFIEGPSIDKIVAKHGGIDPEHACWMTQRLLNALNYMHFHGIVHCDVKPNNIIIKPEEHNAVLVDYGFASLRPRQKTQPEGYTEAFAAPELLALMPPVPQSDLYSLALTMMYAMGGNPLTKTFPKSVPPKIRDFFNQFLNPDPLKRPSWETKDLVKEISDVREQVFGRKTSNKQLLV